MFSNLKNLIGEVFQVIKSADLKELFGTASQKLGDGFKLLKYRLSNLFETNLKNGLTHYYSGHYKDSLLRFRIMDIIWKENYLIKYNLGRVYFETDKIDKAKIYLENALALQPSDEIKTLINYYLQKINNIFEVAFVPKFLKAEYYDYNVSELTNDYLIHENHLKEMFGFSNKHIGDLISKNNNQTKILDMGCNVGFFGNLLRQNYKSIILHGVDISEEMIDRCANLKDDSGVSTYDKLFCEEMHEFLSENFFRLIKLGNEVSKTENKEDDLIIEKEDEIKKKTTEEIEALNDYISEGNSILKNGEVQKNDNDNTNNRDLYSIIISMGTFAEFGDLTVVLKLCEINLVKGGLLIFVVPKSDNDGVQFSKYRDYFFYSEDYVVSAIKDDTVLEIIDISAKDLINENNKQIIVVARNI